MIAHDDTPVRPHRVRVSAMCGMVLRLRWPRPWDRIRWSHVVRLGRRVGAPRAGSGVVTVVSVCSSVPDVIDDRVR